MSPRRRGPRCGTICSVLACRRRVLDVCSLDFATLACASQGHKCVPRRPSAVRSRRYRRQPKERTVLGNICLLVDLFLSFAPKIIALLSGRGVVTSSPPSRVALRPNVFATPSLVDVSSLCQTPISLFSLVVLKSAPLRCFPLRRAFPTFGRSSVSARQVSILHASRLYSFA